MTNLSRRGSEEISQPKLEPILMTEADEKRVQAHRALVASEIEKYSIANKLALLRGPCFSIDTDKHLLSFCLCWKFGAGNRLLQYWSGRALAFWWDYDFILNSTCWENKNEEGNTIDTFLYYLPKQSHLSIHRLQSTAIADSKTETEWLRFLQRTIDTVFRVNTQQIYPFAPVEFAMNDDLTQMVALETWQAIADKVERQIRKTKTESALLHWNWREWDTSNYAAIHFRCGDIINFDRKNHVYGFYGLSFYKKVFEWYLQNNAFPIERVYLVTNLDQRHMRERDKEQHLLDKCWTIVRQVVPKLSLFFQRFDIPVFLQWNGTIETDFFILSKAKTDFEIITTHVNVSVNTYIDFISNH
ncbi:hypothetical protein RFI_03002 [Reticulomyxa filosa]|uniref:Uncharacterized protein n=1 Tax=Reticulomyxa filosa TaxID=46433 RepID=X6P7J7_RETFI|nr:hypothetical protein RFI_03002 [Reticulomyxa filosa]|eukprot:ETO34093.1 hypothetical protein RFI_03002 [Reticulomyxa filosa]